MTHDAPVAAPRSRTASGLAFALVSAVTFGLSGALARPLLESGWSAGAVDAGPGRRRRPAGRPVRRGRPARTVGGLLRRNAGLVVTYGVLAVAGAQFCYFSAVSHMQVGPALLIEYTAPAAVVVWLWLRHGQRPGPVTLVGAGLAALGLVLVLDLLSGADLSVPGVLWALAAMVGAAAYFVISADESNGLPPLALAAGGLVVGTVALALLGLVGLLPLHRASASVEYAGATVAPWVPLALLGAGDRGDRLHDRHRRDPAARFPGRVVRGPHRGAVRRPVGLAAPGRAAAARPAARWRADPRRGRGGQAGRADRGGRSPSGLSRRRRLTQALSQRASWRRMNTSRVSIRIAAAVGIASSAPTTPSSAAPTSAAITVTAPGMSTDFDITRG